MPYIKVSTPQRTTNLPGIKDVYHSENVFANFVPIALWDDPQGPEAATLSQIFASDYAVTSVVTEQIEGDADSPGVVEKQQQKLIDAGVISAADVAKGNNATPSASDTAGAAITTGTTTTSVTLNASIDETVLYVGPATGITWTVKKVTKQPGVIFPYDVATIAPENGVDAQTVCDNLKALVVNVLDPLKAKYPDMFITCTFRKAGVGSPTSQHPRGMAADIQYSAASKADYFTRAQWIRDNLPFDQFLLEYKTTGTKKPWHHISFNRAGNRGQVCTFMNDKNCKGPGVIGLYDLGGVE